MAEVEIVKLKIRRGSEDQRKEVILSEAEPGWSTTTERLWIGNGGTKGGVVAGNLCHASSTSNTGRLLVTRGAVGDITYDNGRLYRLDADDASQASSWSAIDSKLNASFLEYNSSNEISIKSGSITKTQLNSNIVSSNGGVSFNNTSGLSVSVDSSTMTVANGNLKVGTINESNISNTSFGDGLQGGSGTTISLRVDSNFSFSGGVLSLNSVPSGTVNFDAIDPNIFGDGLTVTNSQVDADVQGVNSTLSLSNNLISLKSIGTGGVIFTFEDVTYDEYGRVTNKSSSLNDSLSAYNSTSSHLSAYNGSPTQTTYTDQTVFDVNDGTNTISLTSAGFIQVNTGTALGTIAIPIFKPPVV